MTYASPMIALKQCIHTASDRAMSQDIRGAIEALTAAKLHIEETVRALRQEQARREALEVTSR